MPTQSVHIQWISTKVYCASLSYFAWRSDAPLNGLLLLKAFLISNAFDVSSRCTRSKFWWTFLWIQLFSSIAFVTLNVLEDNIAVINLPSELYAEKIIARGDQLIRGLLAPVFLLYLAIPVSSITARRWNDFGGAKLEGFVIGLSLYISHALVVIAYTSHYEALKPSLAAGFIFFSVYFTLNALRPSQTEDSDLAQTSLTDIKGLSDEKIAVLGEGQHVEFKETWQFDINRSAATGTPTKSSDLQYGCLKTIAGFLNSHGGVLLIGVSDDGRIVGLDRDLEMFRGSEDRMLRNVADTVRSALGKENLFLYSVKWSGIHGKRLLRIEVDANKKDKTWVSFSGKKDPVFFVRNGSQTVSLAGGDTDHYWDNKQAASR